MLFMWNLNSTKLTLQKPHKLQRCRIDIESISLRRRILIETIMITIMNRYHHDIESLSNPHRTYDIVTMKLPST